MRDPFGFTIKIDFQFPVEIEHAQRLNEETDVEKVKSRFLRNNHRLCGREGASPVSLASIPVLLEWTMSMP